MKKQTLTTGIVVLSIAATIILFTTNKSGSDETSKPRELTKEEKVKRGEYLVSVIGCDDCHSPKRMGKHEPEIIPELRLSGAPSSFKLPNPDMNEVEKGWMMFAPDLTSAVGPWGQSYAANLTSDATGIGNWKEEQFIKALREGKYKGLDNTRPLLPPMPWFVYKNMTDDDLKSIFAYLKTTKPVHNIVPSPKTPAQLK
jgi:hypothetical protein